MFQVLFLISNYKPLIKSIVMNDAQRDYICICMVVNDNWLIIKHIPYCCIWQFYIIVYNYISTVVIYVKKRINYVMTIEKDQIQPKCTAKPIGFLFLLWCLNISECCIVINLSLLLMYTMEENYLNVCHFLLYNALYVESMCLRIYEQYWPVGEIWEWVNTKEE